MAEVIGLLSGTITLAGLFKLCIEAFDVVQAGRNQEIEFNKLVLRLNIEKCRLYTWGQAMGLVEANSDEQRLIDISPFQNLVRQTLEIIFQTFHDSEIIKERYGCIKMADQSNAQGLITGPNNNSPTDRLASSFGNFRVRSKPDETVGILGRTRWAVHDRKKFLGLITEIRTLIDGLQHITEPLISARRQENAMKNAILTISDVQTLTLVADVCDQDHQRIASAASQRADTLSIPSDETGAISAWAQTVQQSDDEEELTMAELEGMGVAELKHLVMQLMASVATRDSLQALILEHGDLEDITMRTADMAAEMRAITERTRKETASLKLITLFTLIFLPGTFVSTFFTMDILAYFKGS